MEPVLPEGSAILVDRARRRRRTGGIFVVRTGDGTVRQARSARTRVAARLLVSDLAVKLEGQSHVAARRRSDRRGQVDGSDVVRRNHAKQSVRL